MLRVFSVGLGAVSAFFVFYTARLLVVTDFLRDTRAGAGGVHWCRSVPRSGNSICVAGLDLLASREESWVGLASTWSRAARPSRAIRDTS